MGRFAHTVHTWNHSVLMYIHSKPSIISTYEIEVQGSGYLWWTNTNSYGAMMLMGLILEGPFYQPSDLAPQPTPTEFIQWLTIVCLKLKERQNILYYVYSYITRICIMCIISSYKMLYIAVTTRVWPYICT